MTRLIPSTKLSDELRDIIVKHTSAMLDNHDKYGIYPTTKFYDDLVAAITTAYAEAMNEVIGGDEEVPEQVPLDGTYGGNWDDIMENGMDIGRANGRNQLRANLRLRGLLPNGKDE